MLYVDQALGVLPPTTDPHGPDVAVFCADGVWRHPGGGPVADAVHNEAARIAAVLVSDQFDYVWGIAKALQGELIEGFVDVSPEHPSFDAGIEQVFAPAPDVLAHRVQNAAPHASFSRRCDMALRTFTDRTGVEWQVWDVRPSASDCVAISNADLQSGWLVFESPTEKRRLHPIPDGGETCPLERLYLLSRVTPPAHAVAN